MKAVERLLNLVTEVRQGEVCPALMLLLSGVILFLRLLSTHALKQGCIRRRSRFPLSTSNVESPQC